MPVSERLPLLPAYPEYGDARPIAYMLYAGARILSIAVPGVWTATDRIALLHSCLEVGGTTDRFLSPFLELATYRQFEDSQAPQLPVGSVFRSVHESDGGESGTTAMDLRENASGVLDLAPPGGPSSLSALEVCYCDFSTNSLAEDAVDESDSDLESALDGTSFINSCSNAEFYSPLGSVSFFKISLRTLPSGCTRGGSLCVARLRATLSRDAESEFLQTAVDSARYALVRHNQLFRGEEQLTDCSQLEWTTLLQAANRSHRPRMLRANNGELSFLADEWLDEGLYVVCFCHDDVHQADTFCPPLVDGGTETNILGTANMARPVVQNFDVHSVPAFPGTAGTLRIQGAITKVLVNESSLHLQWAFTTGDIAGRKIPILQPIAASDAWHNAMTDVTVETLVVGTRVECGLFARDSRFYDVGYAPPPMTSSLLQRAKPTPPVQRLLV